MKLFINGQSISIETDEPTLLVALQCYLTPDQQQQSFAVALNGNFSPISPVFLGNQPKIV